MLVHVRAQDQSLLGAIQRHLERRARGALGPMAHASSAARTWRAPRSHAEYTATEDSPMSRHARMIRTAISPRFATRTLRKTCQF